jgi:hypothetical protein
MEGQWPKFRFLNIFGKKIAKQIGEVHCPTGHATFIKKVSKNCILLDDNIFDKIVSVSNSYFVKYMY